MAKKEQAKIEQNLIDFIYESFVKSLYKSGEITIEDFDDTAKLKKKLLKLNSKTEYKIVVSHTEDLLKTAREFRDKDDSNKAKLFYATYFEHELNDLIIELTQKKNIDKKTTTDIIKSVTIIGKLTWLLSILGATKFSEIHKNIILKIADERNAFVHYKYNPENDDFKTTSQEKDNNLKKIEGFKKIENAITYLKKYKSRILFNGNKTHIENKLKAKNKQP